MENFIEELIAEHYKTKGYFVTTNYWIPFTSKRKRIQKGKEQDYEARSWTDIDVLASNNKELLIIQVKAIINQRSVAEKINKYFDRVEQFLKDGELNRKTKIDWWTKDVKVKKMVIYEYYSPDAYLQIIRDNNIEVICFKKYLTELIDYISEKKGVKEENACMRLLHCLKNYGLLNKINKNSSL